MNLGKQYSVIELETDMRRPLEDNANLVNNVQCATARGVGVGYLPPFLYPCTGISFVQRVSGSTRILSINKVQLQL